MASITGAGTNAIFKIASTYGTAVSGGAGNKLAAEISPNFNVETLKPKVIGTGSSMPKTATRGNFKPVISLNMDAGYRNCMDNLLAQFFGTAGAPAEQTASQGDYKHTITFNTSLNAKYGTLAYESSSATVIEYPSCAVRSFTLSASDAPGILSANFELIANNAVITGTVNSNASMASATLTDTEVVAFAFDDTFRMNSSAGATLAGGDQKNILSYSLTLTRVQEIQGEIKGSVGNGSPVATSTPLEGTVTVTLKELADHADFTIWSAETPQKCRFDIQGTQIGSGVNKAVTINIPKMMLVGEPQYSITSAGVNTVTLTYEIVQATANPSGMSSTLPYIEIINNLSTSLLA